MIILATTNKGKIKEFQSMFQSEKMYSLIDLKLNIDIQETGKTLLENAKIKAQTIAQLYPKAIVIADDSGLFVEALKGEPGIYSSRFAQMEADYKVDKDLANNKLLLRKLENTSNRKAYFETVICVYKAGKYYDFSGKLIGEISKVIKNGEGFGYDQVFLVNHKALSELTREEKNQISHRAKAFRKLQRSDII